MQDLYVSTLSERTQSLYDHLAGICSSLYGEPVEDVYARCRGQGSSPLFVIGISLIERFLDLSQEDILRSLEQECDKLTQEYQSKALILSALRDEFIPLAKQVVWLSTVSMDSNRLFRGGNQLPTEEAARSALRKYKVDVGPPPQSLSATKSHIID